MQTTADLPDALYRESEALVVSHRATVELLIVDAVAKEVQANAGPPVSAQGGREIELPLIHSNHPGTLDLSDFTFDDLLG